MQLHLGRLGDDHPRELAVAHALARRAGGPQGSGEVLRVHRPAAPVAVFGRRDTRLPGFAAAVAAVRDAGLAPAVRATGGRAVAYTEQALVVDHVGADADAVAGLEARFAAYGGLIATALGGLGVDARVGPVPGEYCPGAHSVNARGVVKLVGTAQRAIKGAWLFSSLVVVADDARLRPVLGEVYRLLDLPFDEASVGSVSSERPGVRVDEVEDALLAAYGVRREDAVPVDPSVLALADGLVAQHRV